jgi:hypothetical protein
MKTTTDELGDTVFNCDQSAADAMRSHCLAMHEDIRRAIRDVLERPIAR